MLYKWSSLVLFPVLAPSIFLSTIIHRVRSIMRCYSWTRQPRLDEETVGPNPNDRGQKSFIT